ncbi:MAG: hypothetical protein COB35_08405 [Gammaproteobacteria bacterium]|nr:MAG: hypothetical protein COB35_08405 [Gammaproteobacteria bacterium]
MGHYKYLCFLILSAFSCIATYAAQSLPNNVKQHLLQGEYQQVLPILKNLANANNSSAQYQLALYYLKDQKNKNSLKKAEQWLIKAAKNNNKAGYLLGLLYIQNKFEHSTRTKAKKYLLMAQKEGNYKAKKLLKKLQLKTNNTSPSNAQLQLQLDQSIKQGNLDNVKKLYHLGVKLNGKNLFGETPLIVAIKARQYDIAIYLLTLPDPVKAIQKVLNINAQDNNGNTALHFAAIQNQFKISHLLFYNKASINIQNKKKQTPLISALIAKNKIIAQQLINEKANFKIKDKQGKTAIDYAKKYAISLVLPSKNKVEKNHILTEKSLAKKLARLVLQTKDPQSPYFERSILAIAVAQKQNDLILYLLKSGYSPWQGDRQHQNAVITAIIMKDAKVALTLLAQPFPQSLNKNQLIDVFKHTIKYDQSKTLTSLLNIVDLENIKKWPIEQTPLWYAIKYNRISAATAIMRKIPPDNRQDSQHLSYLLLAMHSNLTEISQLLITLKIDVNLQDNKGRTALWYAVDFKNSDITNQLLYANAVTELADKQGVTPLIQAVIKNCSACVEKLINFGADIQKQTKNGNSSLMFAAQGKVKILTTFLNDKRELNIKKRNHHSYTALMLSVQNNCFKCVQLLLNKGANPKRKNKQGEDSLDLAKNNRKIFNLLNNI